MGKEIKKETDWLGREKDVIYEGGKKVGETKHETDWLGRARDITYDKTGNKISETKHETTFFGTSKEVTRDTCGNKISETKYEERIFGGKKGVIYEDGRKIGELKTEKGVFGGRKQVLHESGRDVDLTRREIRKKSARTGESSSLNGGGYGEQTHSLQKECRKRNLDRIIKQEEKYLCVYSFSNPKTIERAWETGFYSGVRFVPDEYLVKYKCGRCGHEWQDIISHIPLNNSVDCMMGCSKGAEGLSLLWFYRVIKGLITGKEPFGYGRLIQSKNLFDRFKTNHPKKSVT